jgi:catechol 2,3-dioxygenase-like lactoylglutathione lyase family enzyme
MECGADFRMSPCVVDFGFGQSTSHWRSADADRIAWESARRRGRTMIVQIHSATILVEDQNKALDFYVGLLGWEKSLDNEMGPGMRFLSVRPGKEMTEIALATPSWYSGDEPRPQKKTGISLIAEDLDGTYADLKGKGVTFSGPPEVMPWGQKAVWMFDPDGNEFFVVDGR